MSFDPDPPTTSRQRGEDLSGWWRLKAYRNILIVGVLVAIASTFSILALNDEATEQSQQVDRNSAGIAEVCEGNNEQNDILADLLNFSIANSDDPITPEERAALDSYLKRLAPEDCGEVVRSSVDEDQLAADVLQACEQIRRTRIETREQFRLSLTEDIKRVQAFIDSGGPATPEAAATLQREVDAYRERRDRLPQDFPDPDC